jgi:SAM-dependent methyltransferase
MSSGGGRAPDPRRHYLGDAGLKYHAGKRALPERALPWVARLRAEKLFPWVRDADTVFEFGVGSGWNMMALDVPRKIGCDVADYVGPIISEMGWEFVGSITEVADHAVDVIICHHVLEHVLSPQEVLCDFRRILKRDGTLLLFVPYESQKRYRKFSPEDPDHHIYSWNVQTLGALVTECGWIVKHGGVQVFGYDRVAATLATRWGIGEIGFRLLWRTLHAVRRNEEVFLVARLPG